MGGKRRSRRPVVLTSELSEADKQALQRLNRWLKPLCEQRGLRWKKTIEELAELDRLELDNLELEGVPLEIGQLATLRNLDLSFNKLAAMPQEVGHLEALRILEFQGNQLSELPLELFQLTALQELYLSKNKIATISHLLGRLTALRRLHLEDNQLLAVPPEIGQLSVLLELDLQRNLLVTLPSEIGRLGALKTLALEGNQLTALPTEIGKLAELEQLNLTSNSLRYLPPALGKLAALKCLWLGRNHLVAVPPELNNLSNLRNFQLQGNKMTGHFTLQPIFDRMATDVEATLLLSGNCFEPVDWWSDEWTTGRLLEPVVFGDRRVRQSVCTASFCGAEFLDWQLLLARTRLQREPLWSQLCVFQPNYAAARLRNSAPEGCHVGGKGSEACRALGQFFEVADEFTAGKASEAHTCFGCCWFQQWAQNIEKAVHRGHSRFVVFTKPDRTVGVCQTVEWLYLLMAKVRFPHIEVHCVSVADSMQVLMHGVYANGFTGAHFPVFRTPTGLPGTLSAKMARALGQPTSWWL